MNTDTLPPLPDLKPCPFCGSTPGTLARPDNIDGTEFYAAVFCHCEGYSATAHAGRRGKTLDEATTAAHAAWNRRAAIAAHVPAVLAAVPAQPVLDCEIQPRPLSYPLTDYHSAGIDGPLHYTWKDKPHRLLYDLIAAVRYYAAPQAVPVPAWQPIETAPKDGSLFLCWVHAVRYGETDEGQSFQQDASQVDFCSWRDGPSDLPEHGYFDPCCGQIGDSQVVTHWMPLPAAPKEQPHE